MVACLNKAHQLSGLRVVMVVLVVVVVAEAGKQAQGEPGLLWLCSFIGLI